MVQSRIVQVFLIYFFEDRFSFVHNTKYNNYKHERSECGMTNDEEMTKTNDEKNYQSDRSVLSDFIV